MSRVTQWLLALVLAATCMAAARPAQAAVEYVHTDALGTPVAITDADGNVLQTSEYEPYGKLLNRPVTDGPGYTGHEEDAATGLTYMQQRYYDPSIGRFLSVDPVAADGNSGGNFNRYAYASNNPYRFTDPDGREIRALIPEQQKKLETFINKLSLGKFKFDAKGKLRAVSTHGNSSKFSSAYQKRLNDAINSPKVIGIQISATATTETGRVIQMDGATPGGGLTSGRAGENQTVIVSGNGNTNIRDAAGKGVPAGPAEILMHELVGHAIPNMVGGGSGNAVTDENEVRSQVPGEGQRAPEENHDEEPNSQ